MEFKLMTSVFVRALNSAIVVIRIIALTCMNG
jgi:hypothetical protein